MRRRSGVIWERVHEEVLLACDEGVEVTIVCVDPEGKRRNPVCIRLLPVWAAAVVKMMPWAGSFGAMMGNCWTCLAGVGCGTWKRIDGVAADGEMWSSDDDGVNTLSDLLLTFLLVIIVDDDSLVFPWTGDVAPFDVWLFFLPILYFTHLNTFKWMSLSSHFGWMTSAVVDAVDAAVQVPSLLTRIITLTRWTGKSVVDDL